jgi:DNA polymerase-3 subunit epsilon
MLVYDTETTGLPDWNKPSEDHGQPHITQIAAQLCDESAGDILASLNVMIKPAGWVIPAELEKLTGITTDKATAYGVPLNSALAMFVELWMRCDIRVAHNESFDARMFRIEFSRDDLGDDDLRDRWKAGAGFCTASSCTKILNLPPTARMIAAGFNKPKLPNLTEAYRHFTGKELVGAHNAAVDLMACKAVYFGIKSHHQNGVAPSDTEGVA